MREGRDVEKTPSLPHYSWKIYVPKENIFDKRI
jgi:hypothetical protein